MRYLFVVNPTAGRGDGLKRGEQIQKFATLWGMDYQIVYTNHPGQGYDLAKKGVVEGAEVLIAVGGDGTVNEVMQGVIDADGVQKIYMGIIPAGTGNDLARTLEIPFDVEEALRVVEQGKIKMLDLGKVQGEHFINVAGIGFDAAVGEEINLNVKKLKGTAAYIYGVFKMLLQYKSPQITIRIDETVLKGRYFLVAIANAKYYGGGMMIAPDAEVADGYYDVVVVKDVKQLEVIKVLPSIFRGKHISHPAVQVYRGKKIQLESNERVLVQTDGEIRGTLPMTFELESKVFPVIVP